MRVESLCCVVWNFSSVALLLSVAFCLETGSHVVQVGTNSLCSPSFSSSCLHSRVLYSRSALPHQLAPQSNKDYFFKSLSFSSKWAVYRTPWAVTDTAKSKWASLCSPVYTSMSGNISVQKKSMFDQRETLVSFFLHSYKQIWNSLYERKVSIIVPRNLEDTMPHSTLEI